MFQLDIKVNQSQGTSIMNYALLVPVTSDLTVVFHQSFSCFGARGCVNTHDRCRWLCNSGLLNSPDFQTYLKAIVVVFEHPIKCQAPNRVSCMENLSVK